MDHKTACRRKGKKCWGGGSTEEGEKKKEGKKNGGKREDWNWRRQKIRMFAEEEKRIMRKDLP